MNYKEFKNICQTLDSNHCYYRHPKKDFVKCLGQDVVNDIVRRGWLKDSPRRVNPATGQLWAGDYRDECYEFGNLFRRVYNFVVTPFGLWLRCYVFQFWRIGLWWKRLRIKMGHKYNFQAYDGVNLDKI